MEDRGGEILLVAVIFLSLCWIAVLLRIFCRFFVVRSLGADDHFMILTLIFFSGYVVAQILAAHHGAGRHNSDVEPDDYSKALMYTYFAEVFYAASTCLLKISVGLLLLRISVKRSHVWAIRTLLLANLVFGVAYLMVVVMQCLPVASFWQRQPHDRSQCMAHDLILLLTYCGAAVNGLVDWGFVILPFFIVWSLRLPLRTCMLAVAILSFAAVGSAATVVRALFLPRQVQEDDLLFAMADVNIWSTIEVGVGITAASFATLHPMYELVWARLGLRPDKPWNASRGERLDDEKENSHRMVTVLSVISEHSRSDEEVQGGVIVKVEAASTVNSEGDDASSQRNIGALGLFSSANSSETSVANAAMRRRSRREAEAKRRRFMFASSSMVGLQVVPQGQMLHTRLHSRRSTGAESHSGQIWDVNEDSTAAAGKNSLYSGSVSELDSLSISAQQTRDTVTADRNSLYDNDNVSSVSSDTPRLNWSTPRVSRISMSSYWAGSRSQLSRADSVGASLHRRGTQRLRRIKSRDGESGSQHIRPRRMPSGSSQHFRPRRIPSGSSLHSQVSSMSPSPTEPVPELPVRFLRLGEQDGGSSWGTESVEGGGGRKF